MKQLKFTVSLKPLSDSGRARRKLFSCFRVRTGNSYFIEKKGHLLLFLLAAVTHLLPQQRTKYFIFVFSVQVHWGRAAFSEPGVRFLRVPQRTRKAVVLSFKILR